VSGTLPPAGCVDDVVWADAEGRSCADYAADGWCSGAYFAPGFETKASTDMTEPGPEAKCCACGKGRGGCLQSRIDQYCLSVLPGADVVARKDALVWNCYAAEGEVQGSACVDVSGRYSHCRVGKGPSLNSGQHSEAIGAILREGCISRQEQERLKKEREEVKRKQEQAVHSGEITGSCIQEAMNGVCQGEIPGSVSRRFYTQFICCRKTRPSEPGDGEQSYECVDQNGYFVPCAPCDTSDPQNYEDRSDALRTVMRNGCREPKLLKPPKLATEEGARGSGAGHVRGAGLLATVSLFALLLLLPPSVRQLRELLAASRRLHAELAGAQLDLPPLPEML